MARTIWLLWLFFCTSMLAQETARDSLERLLDKNLDDTTRIRLLLESAKIHSKDEQGKAGSLLRDAVGITQKLEQPPEQAIGYETVGQYLLHTGAYDSAISYFKKALEIDEVLKDAKRLSSHHDNLGTAYYYMGDYNQTLYHFLERLAYCEALADSTCISAASNNAGLVLINLGRYEDAVAYTLRSLKIDETSGYQPGILSSQMSLGNINFYLGNYQKAISYYEDIVATCEEMGNQELRISYAYNNIASIYFQQREFEKAAEFYKKSLDLEEAYGDKKGVALKFNNLGSVYMELGDLDSAETYFRKALRMRGELKDLNGLSSTESNLGQLYLSRGAPSRALTFYQKALKYAEEAGSPEAAKIASEGIAKSYKEMGQFRQALEYYERFLSLNDSTLNAEKAKTIAELEARYESEQKESEIALLKKNEELQQAQLVQQEASLRAGRLQRNALIAGLAILLILILLLVYSYRQRLAAKELIQRNQRETEEIRKQFFAGISHEFRTPLTLISGPVGQLKEKYPHEAETQWMLGLIQRNANALLKLINQILDLSKLEAGKLELQVASGDIASWLRVLSASFTSLAESRELTYTRHLPGEPIITYFDRDKVEQIVTNLLSNAMKFTPKSGKIEFLVTRIKNKLKVEVRNTGSPISKMDQSRIFERFYQTESHGKSQGTGIGLALVKELTELHHGEVDVQSDNHYTSFTVTLPLDDLVYAEAIRTESKDAPLDLDPVTSALPEAPSADSDHSRDLPIVLLAEDNDDLRSYLRVQLRDQYELMEAQNGRLAWEIAHAELPDLVVTDLMMPEMDGEGFLEKLREDSKTQHIPVIMLTARNEQASKLSTIRKGADHFLAKPFEIEELKVRMQSLLKQRERIRDYHKSQFLTSPKAEAITSSDDRFLQQVGQIMARNLDNGDFTVDEFASEMGMSRVQLYRKMKATIGYSVSDFIRQYRLKKAFEYLENQKGSVSEIAYEVGFNNLSYFTKVFKEAYGRKPSEVLQKVP